MIYRFFATFLGLIALPASAAPAPQLDMVTTFGSLALVVGLILVMAWLLKRMRLPTMSGQKDLKVVRQVAVGTRERIAVVQAGEEQFLVGITTQSVNLISRLDKPITEPVTDAAPFANQLTQLLKKDDKK